MRLIQWLCFIILFSLAFCLSVLTVNGQTLRGDALGLRPTALPATCNIGDLRVDSADAYRLKLCNALNTWSIASFADPMTTDGDLITQAAGVPARLGIGSTSHVLQVVGGAPAWGFVTDANVDAAAGIVDTKLATISTSGKVANSATTATDANFADSIVARDGSGDFTASTIFAALTGNVTGNVSGSSGSTTGNAATATALAANPTDCASNTYANAIAASGNLTCATVTNAGLAGSIAASKLVGTDIATVGTVTSGTWSATEIDETKGGTGLTSYTAGDSIYATGSNTLGKVGIGASGQVWTVTGASTMGWTTPLGVNARYASTSGNSIGNGSIDIIDFATADYDASSAVTTGAAWKFTVPAGQGGKYRVSAAVVFASQAWNAGNLISLYLYINGNPTSRLGSKQLDANITARQGVSGTDTIALAAGDYIDIRGEHGESAARTLTTTGGDNHVSIERIGN